MPRGAHAVFADYYAALVDETGMLKQGFSGDGLHPNDKGYALLDPGRRSCDRESPALNG